MLSAARILLTGGTGFFGRALLRHFLHQSTAERPGPIVHVVTRSPERFLNSFPEFSGVPWLRLLRGDILRPETLPSRERYTHMIHAAADSSGGSTLAPLARHDQIVQGTRHVLDCAGACGAKRLLFTSSGGVYGAQPAHMERIPEDWHGTLDPLNPANVYGLAKRSAESLCALYADAYGLEIVVARCFAFVGRDLPMHVHFAIGNFISAALRSESITVRGDGTPLRSYLDQRDLAVWLLALLERGSSGRAYNVGSDRVITIGDLAYLVRDLLSPGKPVHFLGQPEASHQRSRYVPNTTRIIGELDLKVTIPLEQAIVDAAKSLNPAKTT